MQKKIIVKIFSGPWEAPRCLPDGPVLQELLRGRTQKRLGRIFSFRIFLNLLNPLELPIPLVALLELEKLTAIQLGCASYLIWNTKKFEVTFFGTKAIIEGCFVTVKMPNFDLCATNRKS